MTLYSAVLGLWRWLVPVPGGDELWEPPRDVPQTHGPPTLVKWAGVGMLAYGLGMASVSLLATGTAVPIGSGGTAPPMTPAAPTVVVVDTNTVRLLGSDYDGNGTHASTDWEIFRYGDTGNVVAFALASDSLEQVTIVANDSLKADTLYAARYQYTDEFGNSGYSDTSAFVNAVADIAVGNLVSARWSNGTGDGDAAVNDGGIFAGPANGIIATSGARTLDVVTAASVDADEGDLAGYTGGVLRMRMVHEGYGQMTALDAVPESTTHWGRVYYRSNSGRRSQHGSGYIATAAPGSYNHWQILSLEHYGGETAASPLQWGIRTAATYPNDRHLSPELSKGTWYRFEWQIEYVTATTVRVWPRIYNLAGTLLYDSDDFENWEGGSLTTFYASNTIEIGAPEDTPDADEARDFTLGLEGPSDANGYDPDPPAYIYMAAFDLSSVDWIGR